MKTTLTLDLDLLARGLLRAGLEYEKDTMQTIKTRDIWDTGDLWGSIEADNTVKRTKNEMSITVRSQSNKLGKTKRSSKTGYKRNVKTNYSKFVHDGTKYMRARPFFDWTYKANQKKYDDLILDNVQVNIKGK